LRGYHHIEIPTREIKAGEVYLEKFRVYVSGFDESPYGIEWMRFEDNSPMPEIVKTVPHSAFGVENLDEAIRDKKSLIEPNYPSPGVRVAFIGDNGAPI